MRLKLHVWTAIVLFLASAPVLGIDMFPAAQGNRWEYETARVQSVQIKMGNAPAATMRDVQSGKMECSIISMPSSTSFDYQELVTLTDNRGKTQTDKTVVKFLTNSKGFYIDSIKSIAGDASVKTEQNYSPALFYFASDAHKGKAWDVGAILDKNISEMFRAKGGGRENITVPAGTFENCLKVVYTSDGATGTFDAGGVTFTPTGGQSINIYWIAEGVGIVKELEVSTTKAEAKSPTGAVVLTESASCTVSELMPGFKAEKSGKK